MGLFANEKHPVAENISQQGFYIPSGLALSESDMHRVAETVRKELQ